MSAVETLHDQVKQYEQEGYTIFRNVLGGDLIEETRAHIDWLLRKNPDKRPEQLTHELMTNDAFWVRLISDDRLLDIAQGFLGPDIALFASHYICKPPGDGQAVLWHQDGGYWPLKPMKVVTLWLAVDRSDQGNGCMKIIPGTQNVDLQKIQERTDVDNVLSSGIDESIVDESKAVDIVLDPGDVSVHHPNVIHGSYANDSDRWRRGLTIRYIPATTQIVGDSPNPNVEASGTTMDGKPFPSAFFLRGKPAENVNLYNPWPRYSPETSMKFKDVEEWNRKAERWNGQHSSYYA